MRSNGRFWLSCVVGLLLAQETTGAHVHGAWFPAGVASTIHAEQAGPPSEAGRVRVAAGISEPGSQIVIAFADGLLSTAKFGLPALAARGLHGVAFVPTAMVGTPRHMTLRDLEALSAAGWDIASHLDSGGDGTTMPPGELLGRLVASHDWLVQNGFVAGARIFGPPAQKWAPELTPLATAAGYAVILVSRQKGGIVPQNLVPVYMGCANKIPLSDIETTIRRAKSKPGRLVILSFHDIVASNPIGTDADVQRLEVVLGLAVASGLPIVTVSDLMSGDAPPPDS